MICDKKFEAHVLRVAQEFSNLDKPEPNRRLTSHKV